MPYKPSREECVEKMKKLADDLRREPSARVRMMMQQNFVKEMSTAFGHERATRMLTVVWKYANRKETEEEE